MQRSGEPKTDASHESDSESHVDGCLCDIAIEAPDQTADADLPGATGGLFRPTDQTDDDDHLDGCDIDFLTYAATGDEDLPEATGGCG